MSDVFIETVAAYIKARESDADISERLFRFQEMKDALKRQRLMARTGVASTAEHFDIAKASRVTPEMMAQKYGPLAAAGSKHVHWFTSTDEGPPYYCACGAFLDDTNSINEAPTVLPVDRAASDEMDRYMQKLHDAAPEQVLKDAPLSAAALDRIAATPVHPTTEGYAAFAKAAAQPFADSVASKCSKCGAALPMHGPYFMPCTKCPPEPRSVFVLSQIAAAIADRDLAPGATRYWQWPMSERVMYDDMARAVVDHLSPLRAAWVDVFGLVVCRNGSKADQEKVSRFWTLMNQLTGLSKPTGMPEPLVDGWFDASKQKPPVGPAPNGQPCNSGWSKWVLCCNIDLTIDDLGSPLFVAAYSHELGRWHRIANDRTVVTHWRDDVVAPARPPT